MDSTQGGAGAASAGTKNASNFSSTAMSGMGSMASAAGGVFSSMPTPHSDLNGNNLAAAGMRDAASKALLSGAAGPWGMAAGAAIMAIDKTGGFTDATKGLGKKNDTLNMISALAFPGAGWTTKALPKYKMSDDMKQMSGGYGGAVDLATIAMGNSGAKAVFGRKEGKQMIYEAQRIDKMISNVKTMADDARDRLDAMTIQTGMANALMLSGGYDLGLARAAKNGGTLLARLERARATVKAAKKGGTINPQISAFSFKSVDEDAAFFASIPEFKKGGTIEESKESTGGDYNVIPEGALHARLHHMENAEELTKKGIPVVSEKDGGELEQLAEIEVNEIIFRLEISKKLEDLYDRYKHYDTSEKERNELAIEAGKLLTCEIMENTLDRTGLINEVV